MAKPTDNLGEAAKRFHDIASHLSKLRTAHTLAVYVSDLFREAGGDVREINRLQMSLSELKKNAAAQFDIHLPS